MKRFLALAILIISITGSSLPAFATASENGCRDSDMLYSINTANTSATLTIDGGSSLSAVSVKGKSGVTKICISP